MIISRRLKLISDLVKDVDSVVDVGTDHGYVVIDLLKEGRVKKAIASDINKGPVERARKNVADHNLSDKIECRLGGGLTTVKPGEVQAAVIAGMGGNLIRDILLESEEVFKQLNYVIVQPVQNPEVLREYVYKLGWNLEDEWIIFDEDKYYEIFKVSYGTNPKIVEPIYNEVSEILLKKKDSVYKEYLMHKVAKYSRIYEGLKEDTENAKARKNELKVKLEALEGFLKEF